MWCEDEEKPDDHVNDGNASKRSRYAALDVMKNGQEPQVFIVENLLWIRRRCFHGEEIITISSNGLANNQSLLLPLCALSGMVPGESCQAIFYRPFNSMAKKEVEILMGLKYRHDLEGENGGSRRGWKGLGMVGRIDVAEPKK
jgi:hypothetical protein